MLTLAEASKLIQNPLQKGVVEIFARTSPVLQYLPFMTIAGNAYSWNMENTLPGIAFRGYNASYTEDTGVVQQSTEALKIFGGLVKLDRAQVKTQGNVNNIRAIHTGLAAKAAALHFTSCFFKGDNDADSNEFDGLENRLTGAQVINQGSTSGGDELTLAQLDLLLDSVYGGPDVLFMNKHMRRKVNSLMRAAGQAQETVSGVFGQQIPAYAGVPIGIIEEGRDGNEILAYDEPDSAGASASCTSIYAVKFGAQEYVSGLQASGGLEVEDQGAVETFLVTLIEWICSIAIFHPKAAARLQAIKLAGYDHQTTTTTTA